MFFVKDFVNIVTLCEPAFFTWFLKNHLLPNIVRQIFQFQHQIISVIFIRIFMQCLDPSPGAEYSPLVELVGAVNFDVCFVNILLCFIIP